MIVFALSSIDRIGWGCGWPQTDVKLWRCKVLYSCRFCFALSAFFDKSGVSQLPWVVLAICLYYFLFSQSPDQVVKTPYVWVACEQVLLRGLGLRESQKAQVDGRVGREGGEVPVTLFPLPWEPIHKCLSRLQLTVYYFAWCKVNIIIKYQTSIKSWVRGADWFVSWCCSLMLSLFSGCDTMPPVALFIWVVWTLVAFISLNVSQVRLLSLHFTPLSSHCQRFL